MSYRSVEGWIVAAIEAALRTLERDREDLETVPVTGWPTLRVYGTFFDAVDYRDRVWS